jgi:hypothetical protein
MTAEHRAARLVRKAIADQALDLSGLTVFTEAASGPYLHTPILAAVAGAEKVYAQTADSSYAPKEEVRDATELAARELGVAGRLELLFDKAAGALAESDIVTNSGFVRPIDRATVAQLKPTAVVPLMWETWEFRPEDMDLDACRERGILVLGTDESRPPLALYPYGGYAALKLLFELGLEGYKTRTVLLGGGQAFGRSVWELFTSFGMEVAWFADSEPEARPYEELPEYVAASAPDVDAILVSEHQVSSALIGPDGLVSATELARLNPALAVGVISGNVDAEELEASGLPYRPRRLRPFGYMSYQPGDLGPRPVLELYAAGLKVGEAMARARLDGMSIDDATAYALEHSPAVAFPS